MSFIKKVSILLTKIVNENVFGNNCNSLSPLLFRCSFFGSLFKLLEQVENFPGVVETFTELGRGYLLCNAGVVETFTELGRGYLLCNTTLHKFEFQMIRYKP